jgi:hypothetical protein
MRYENQVVLDMTPQANSKPSPDAAPKHPAGKAPAHTSKAARAKGE